MKLNLLKVDEDGGEEGFEGGDEEDLPEEDSEEEFGGEEDSSEGEGW